MDVWESARTGRPFFLEAAEEAALIDRVQTSLSKADWFCLDCELMPWSAKARDLIQRQYASVGAAGVAALATVVRLTQQSPAAAGMTEGYIHRLGRVTKYRDAYRRYCWPVKSLDDYRLAPFHLLASEGAVHVDKSHRWHMEVIHRLATFDTPFLLATSFLEVDLGDKDAVEQASSWWEEIDWQRR